MHHHWSRFRKEKKTFLAYALITVVLIRCCGFFVNRLLLPVNPVSIGYWIMFKFQSLSCFKSISFLITFLPLTHTRILVILVSISIWCVCVTFWSISQSNVLNINNTSNVFDWICSSCFGFTAVAMFNIVYCTEIASFNRFFFVACITISPVSCIEKTKFLNFFVYTAQMSESYKTSVSSDSIPKINGSVLLFSAPENQLQNPCTFRWKIVTNTSFTLKFFNVRFKHRTVLIHTKKKLY